jgi:2-phospho-L-lactate transferase/gluconeogenesis factor (CofD/UPF0052 family)
VVSYTSADEALALPFLGTCPLSSAHPTPGGNPAEEPSLVVFSGGTAFNSVASHVSALTTRVTHVLPVSDDGGSTAEIVRVLGGPAVGDIRSRCLRLADGRDAEAEAVRRLLAHRLPSASAAEAKRDWYAIVEGEHPLWEVRCRPRGEAHVTCGARSAPCAEMVPRGGLAGSSPRAASGPATFLAASWMSPRHPPRRACWVQGVSEPYKHTIRAFLVHFHVNILRHSTERFNFRSGSVGNFFFAGARIFFRSLEAAIFLFSRVARIPEGSSVVPAICTEERISLAAELADGSVLLGQNAISHPSAASAAGTPQEVNKRSWDALPSPVRRVFYLSSEGDRQEHEVAPAPNPRVLAEVARADAVVYGMGSLYTSIAPSLVLKGVGEAVAGRDCPKARWGGVQRLLCCSCWRPGVLKLEPAAPAGARGRR